MPIDEIYNSTHLWEKRISTEMLRVSHELTRLRDMMMNPHKYREPVIDSYNAIHAVIKLMQSAQKLKEALYPLKKIDYDDDGDK